MVILIDTQLSRNMYSYFPIIRLVNFVLVAPVIVLALLFLFFDKQPCHFYVGVPLPGAWQA